MNFIDILFGKGDGNIRDIINLFNKELILKKGEMKICLSFEKHLKKIMETDRELVDEINGKLKRLMNLTHINDKIILLNDIITVLEKKAKLTKFSKLLSLLEKNLKSRKKKLKRLIMSTNYVHNHNFLNS